MDGLYFKNHVIFFGHTSLTHHEAEEFCEHYGSHLVHIANATENTFIKSYLGDLSDHAHWIALRDDVIEGLWTWYDTDTVATFTNWAPGQPDNGKLANCGAIWSTLSYNWADDDCMAKLKPLCEKRNVKPTCTCTENIVG